MKRLHAGWGAGLVVAIVVFVLGILALVAIALREDVNLVHDRYYDRGQQYGTRLRALERAQALHDPMIVRVVGEKLAMTYPHAVSPAEITGIVTLYRPSNRSMDRTLAVGPDSGWTQSIAVGGLERGLWKVQVEWRMGGEAYYMEQPVILQGY
jgi:hypothetical protein